MQLLQDRLIESILPADPAQRQRLVESARKQAQAMRADGTWADVNYADQMRSGWALRRHLERTLLMAKACRILGPDEASPLRAKLDLAINHWLEKDYRNSNWWWNQIGVPQLIGEAFVLPGRDYSPRQLEQAIAILKRSTWAKWTGQNLVWGVQIQVLRGLLEENAETIARAFERMYAEVVLTTAEGIQYDYSFHQHGHQLYSGGYGLAFANDVGRYAWASWGTPWQIPAEKLAIYEHFMLDGEAWMTWSNVFDYSAVGREIVRPGKSAAPWTWLDGPISPAGASYSLYNTARLMATLPTTRAAEYSAFAARLANTKDAPTLAGNRHFWRSDYMVHRRPGWMTSLKMLSDRITNAELVNDEGKLSHHLSEGATLIYRGGDEYRDIFPVWDWAKIPGTTAEQRELRPDGKAIIYKGGSSFVGGCSNGTFGLATMRLKRENLSAIKSWFFLDDAWLALGCGITGGGDGQVVTSINQCRLKSEVKRGRDARGEWLWHDGIGYLVLGEAKLNVSAGEQAGSWSRIGPGSADKLSMGVLSAWIEHEVRPRDASYAYIVMPGSAPGAKCDVEILSNTPAVQAVRDSKRGLTMIAFHQAGETAGMAVDQPCLLMLRGKTLTLSNPENKPLRVNVTIGGARRAVDLPDGESAGSSVSVALP